MYLTTHSHWSWTDDAEAPPAVTTPPGKLNRPAHSNLVNVITSLLATLLLDPRS